MSEKIEEYENAEAVVRNNDGVLEGQAQKLKMKPKSKQNTQDKYMNYRKKAYNKLMRIEEEKNDLKNIDENTLSDREKRKVDGRLNVLEMKIKFIEIKENKRLYSRGRRPIKIAKGVFGKIKSFCSFVATKFRKHYIDKNSEFASDNLKSLSGMADQINDYVENGFAEAENEVNKNNTAEENQEKQNISNENSGVYRMRKEQIIQDDVAPKTSTGVDFSKVNIDAAPTVEPVTPVHEQINVPDIEIDKNEIKPVEDTSVMEVPSLPEEFSNIFNTSGNEGEHDINLDDNEADLTISREPVVVEEKTNDSVEEKKEESILDSMTTDSGEIDYLATQKVLSEIERKYDNAELLELSKQLAKALNENLMEKQNSGIIKEQRQVSEETQQAVNREYEESTNQLKNTIYSALENVQTSTQQLMEKNEKERAIVDSIKQDVESKRQMTNANRTYISTVGEFNSYKSADVSENSNTRGGK